MSDGNSGGTGGIGAVGLLGVLFVGLKLANVIGWSWWWVTAPFWGAVALWVVLVVLVGAFVVLRK